MPATTRPTTAPRRRSERLAAALSKETRRAMGFEYYQTRPPYPPRPSTPPSRPPRRTDPVARPLIATTDGARSCPPRGRTAARALGRRHGGRLVLRLPPPTPPASRPSGCWRADRPWRWPRWPPCGRRREELLRQWLSPRWVSFSRGVRGGGAAVRPGVGLLAAVSPPGSPREVWLVSLYGQIGDPRVLQAHGAVVAAAIARGGGGRGAPCGAGW